MTRIVLAAMLFVVAADGGDDEISKARRVLDEDRQRRASECQIEINAALKRHRCELVVSHAVVEGRIVGEARIRPKD